VQPGRGKHATKWNQLTLHITHRQVAPLTRILAKHLCSTARPLDQYHSCLCLLYPSPKTPVLCSCPRPTLGSSKPIGHAVDLANLAPPLYVICRLVLPKWRQLLCSFLFCSSNASFCRFGRSIETRDVVCLSKGVRVLVIAFVKLKA